MMRFFRKEIFANKLYLKSTGAPVAWEKVGDDGILATDNPVVIDELDQAASRGVGGVVKIEQAEYDDLKKKALSSQWPLNSLKDRFSLSGLNLPNLAGAAELNSQPIRSQGQFSGVLRDIPKETPQPITIETEFTRPKTGKFFKDVSK